MQIPDRIPQEKRELLEQLVAHLSQVPNMAAVVLGGSYARGTQHSTSDMDVGLYYLKAQPFSIEEIRRVAESLALPGTQPVVTGFYEWGAWVNGGAWIQTRVSKLDFLYRNIEHVQRTIDDARQGLWQHDYDQQPANGFYSVGYLAETQICLALYDPELRIARLKEQVQVYPPALKQKIISDSLWSAEFTLQHAAGFAEKADVYNTAGCLVRAAANLTQALFALNETYFLSDKKVMETLASFTISPKGYAQVIQGILACPGKTSTELSNSVAQLEAAWQSVARLAESYRPKY